MYCFQRADGLAATPERVCCGMALIVVILFSCTVARGQANRFIAKSVRENNFVSVHRLQIPAKAESEFEKGIQRLTRQDPEGSLRYFTTAIEIAPGFYEAYYHQAVAESQLGRNEEALAAFQRAVDLSDGHYPRAEFGYALVLCRMGQAKEAEFVVRHGIETDPNIADGHIVLGLVLLRLQRLDEADKSVQEALALQEPSSIKARLVLADIAAARGDYAAEAENLDAYLNANPKDRRNKFLQVARDMARKMASQAYAKLAASAK